MKLKNLPITLLIALLITACAEIKPPVNVTQATPQSTVIGQPLAAAHSTGKAKVTLLYKGHVEPIEGKTFLPWSTHDGARSLSTSVFVIESGGKIMVGDPGEVRKGEWPKIMQKLADMGITPEDVDYVWIDHHHPDHTMHLGAFPNAPVVDYWSIYTDEIWTDHPDNFGIMPGVIIIRTPGHTKEDSSLLVDTDDGVMLITHMWWHNDLTPIIDPVGEDQKSLDKHRKELLKKADLLLPTHAGIMKNPFKYKEYDSKP